MTSKAWFKPSAVPHLVAKFDSAQSSRSIEIWTTTCIVTNFGMQRNRNVGSHSQATEFSSIGRHLPRCSMLINPANPVLTGPHSFPYFPRGGPQPENPPNRTAHHIMGYVTQWGGMDVGNGMLFPAAVIDGLVHQLGGRRLQNECSMLPKHSFSRAYSNQQSQTTLRDDQEVKCPVGAAVVTSSGDKALKAEYDIIIHTVPPFYKYPPSANKEIQRLLDTGEEPFDGETWSYKLLLSCYHKSFDLAFQQRDIDRSSSVLCNLLNRFGYHRRTPPENQRVAVPLLGAGCRGFPTSVAIEAAAKESAAWLTKTSDGDNSSTKSTENNTPQHRSPQSDCVIAFGLLEPHDAETLAEKIQVSLNI
jgi:O-acetyl-ADP-ribose deacetylase (regulator of RNase III)